MRALELLEMGGNLSIGAHQADEIDLKVHNRTFMVGILDKLLHAINNAFAKQYKKPLWSPELIQSREFLSGSSLHFFNTKGISDDEFIKHKPKVGDIDTQCDKQLETEVQEFLAYAKNKKIGNATFLGFDRGNEQFNGLFLLDELPIKIQIDFEFGRYDPETNAPDEWYKFSHSSDWNDITAGVKGVFHKYIHRSLAAASASEKYVARQLKRSVKINPEPVIDGNLSFAVSSGQGGGLRRKYKPYIDPETGKQKFIDDIPVMLQLHPGESEYVQNLDQMFELTFNRKSSPESKNLMGSFLGTIQLANQYMNDQARDRVADRFIDICFAPSSQMITKNDPERDRGIKFAAIDTMLEKMKLSNAKTLRAKAITLSKEYESSFRDKQAAKQQPVAEDVQATPRQGVQHLQKMRDVDFINFVRRVKNELHGQLGNIKMNLKVDGLGARFGKDADGHPFFESSHSGPIFTGGMFSAHAKSQGFEGDRLQRAQHYDNIFNLIVGSVWIKKLPNDTKVTCELLYNPMAEEQELGFKFVNMTYDKDKLGSVISIVPFEFTVASTGDAHPKAEQIKDYLLKQTTPEVKFIDNRVESMNSLDVGAIIDPVLSLNDQSIAVLSSRTRADAADKEQVKALLNSVKDELANFIIDHPDIIGKGKLGKEIEGLILNVPGQAPIKVTTPLMKQKMAQKQIKTNQNPPV